MREKSNYRPDEVATAFDVDVRTVRRWCQLGLVLHIHCPRDIRIPHDEFMRILKEGPYDENVRKRTRKHQNE